MFEEQWPDDRIETLRKLWSEGHTSVTIGQMMGLSKNSVLGKAHRLKLPARSSVLPARASKLFTPARDDIIRRLYQTHVSLPNIQIEVNADGWVPVSTAQISSRAGTLGVCRPVDYKPAGGWFPKSIKPSAPRQPRLKLQGALTLRRIVATSSAIVPAGHPLQCRAPTGESPRIRFECLNEQAPGRSYCSAHCRIFYVRRDEAIAA